MRIRVIALLLTFFTLNSIQSQDLSFVWEPFLHEWEDGVDDPELVALNGYVTWRLYLQIDGDTGQADEPEYFSSIVGEGADCDSDFSPVEILFTPSADLLLLNEDTCCLFQHPSGSTLGESINEGFCAFSPSLCYDSWVSCGASNSSEAGGTCSTLVDPGDITDPDDNGQDWVSNFNDCTTQGILINTCTGGGWFTVFDPSNESTQFDENNQLLIGQFTVAIGCELNQGSMCVQYFIDGDQSMENIVCLEFDQPSACFNNPIFSSITSFTDSLACTGNDSGVIDFYFEGGSTNLNASLYDSNNNLIQGPISGLDPEGNIGSFSNLVAGTYYIQVDDNVNLDIDGLTPCQSITEEITIYEAPELLALNYTIIEDVACAGLNEGEIEITISGGLQPYSEPTCSFPGFVINEISPNTFEFSNLDSSSGGIDFEVTDALGCLVEINVPQLGDEDALVVDIDNITEITCADENNGAIDISISSLGNPLITWTSSATLVNPNSEDQENLGPGWYHFTVDDGLSCVYEADTIFLIEPEPLNIENATPSFIDCFGDCNSTVDITTTGGTGEITFEFIQNALPAQNGSLCAGEAGLTATDENGCFDTENVQIGQNFEIVINESPTDVSCPEGCDGTICIAPEGGIGTIIVEISPLTNFDSNTSCFTGLCAGTYVLTATDELGCQVETSVIITQPNPFIVNYTTSNITCNGDCNGSIVGTSITGGTEPYEFSIDDGTEITTVNDLSFSELCPGNYLFSFEDGDGCIYSETEPIVISEPEALSIDTIITTPAGCGGDNTATAEITVSGGTAPLIPYWNQVESGLTDFTALAEDLFDGENEFSLVDGNGCSLDTIFDILGTDPLTININPTNVTCTGMCNGSYLLSFLGGVEPYNSIIPNIPQEGICEGNYPVFVEDAVGCTAMDTIRIMADSISNITYTVFQTPVSCWNENDGTATVAATGGYGPLSYQWSDAASQTTATAIGLVEDFYTVTITDTIGCTFTENVVIEPTVGCFLIANAITPNGDGYNDLWILGGIEYFPEATVEVFNRWGQKVYESRGIYTPWDGKFNNQRLPIADYYYVITFEADSAPLTGTVTIKY